MKEYKMAAAPESAPLKMPKEPLLDIDQAATYVINECYPTLAGHINVLRAAEVTPHERNAWHLLATLVEGEPAVIF
jgi:hypothetical protein